MVGIFVYQCLKKKEKLFLEEENTFFCGQIL